MSETLIFLDTDSKLSLQRQIRQKLVNVIRAGHVIQHELPRRKAVLTESPKTWLKTPADAQASPVYNAATRDFMTRIFYYLGATWIRRG